MNSVSIALTISWLGLTVAFNEINQGHSARLSNRIFLDGKNEIESGMHPLSPQKKILEDFTKGLAVGASLVTLLNTHRSPSVAASYPVYGSEDIMSRKSHGTSETSVMNPLRWRCDINLADKICNYNRHFAEHAGYWATETTFLNEIKGLSEIKFYDSVTGSLLFIAPKGRSIDDFIFESRMHGWPSFRDSEVVWDNVRCLKDGETVSLSGTHLGHNLPDFSGNR